MWPLPTFPTSCIPLSLWLKTQWCLFFKGPAMWHLGFQFPDQRPNLHPLHWKCGASTTGSLSKSPTTDVSFLNTWNPFLPPSLALAFFLCLKSTNPTLHQAVSSSLYRPQGHLLRGLPNKSRALCASHPWSPHLDSFLGNAHHHTTLHALSCGCSLGAWHNTWYITALGLSHVNTWDSHKDSHKQYYWKCECWE